MLLAKRRVHQDVANFSQAIYDHNLVIMVNWDAVSL